MVYELVLYDQANCSKLVEFQPSHQAKRTTPLVCVEIGSSLILQARPVLATAAGEVHVKAQNRQKLGILETAGSQSFGTPGDSGFQSFATQVGPGFGLS